MLLHFIYILQKLLVTSLTAFLCSLDLCRLSFREVEMARNTSLTFFFFSFFSSNVSFVLFVHFPFAGSSGSLTWVMLKQLQEQCYLLLPAHAVFSSFQTMVWLPVRGILNVRTDVNASNCPWGLYGHCKRVHWKWKSTLGEKSLIAPGSWTLVSSWWASRYTSWVTSMPHCF